MQQQVVLGFSLSTAIYLQLFNKRFGFYPNVYYNKIENLRSYPIIIDNFIFSLFKVIFPGIQVIFKKVHGVHNGSKSGSYEKYILQGNIIEFLMDYFKDKNCLHFNSAINVTGEGMPKDIFSVDKIGRKQDIFEIISFGANNLISESSNSINTGYVEEIFHFPKDTSVINEDNLYEFSLTAEKFIRVWQEANGVSIGLNYQASNRESDIRNIESHIPHMGIFNSTLSFKDSLSSEKYPILISLNSGKGSNVILLGNGLGYTVPIENLSILLAFTDTIMFFQTDYQKILSYREKIYKIQSFYFNDKSVNVDEFLIHSQSLFNFFKKTIVTYFHEYY